jgi:hypothetical protein
LIICGLACIVVVELTDDAAEAEILRLIEAECCGELIVLGICGPAVGAGVDSAGGADEAETLRAIGAEPLDGGTAGPVGFE